MNEKPDETWELRELVDWVEKNDKQELLDEVIIDLALAQASEVNNQRVSKQVEWLIMQMGPEDTKEAILNAIAKK